MVEYYFATRGCSFHMRYVMLAVHEDKRVELHRGNLEDNFKLGENGLVKVENFTASKNKFGYVYLLTPTGVAEKLSLTGAFIQRKLAERERIEAEISEVLAACEAHTSWVGTDTNTALPLQAQTLTVARTRTVDYRWGGVKRNRACPDIEI